MASEAHPKTLRDYFTLQRGTTYKSRLLEQPGPVLLGLATIQRNGGFRSDSLRTYGGDSPENLLVQPGELYASLKDVTQSADLLGAVAKLPIGHAPGRLTQDTVKLEPKFENVPIDYIYWLLRTPQYRTYCRAHATGTTNLGLPRDDFLAYPVPELTTARSSIVDTLTALDDKIELNRRMNETLEEMARALFKSWFVDFDPVHAKAALKRHAAAQITPPPGGSDWTVERARSYLDGMDPSVAALFPDSFVDSELGEIPEGWQVKALGELAEVTSGKRPQLRLPTTTNRVKVPVWGGNGPMAFTLDSLIDQPVLITGRVGTLGSVFRVTSPCWPSDNTLVVKPQHGQSFEFLFFHMQRIDFVALNRGSTQPLLTQSDIKAQNLTFPAASILEHFSTLAGIWCTRIDEAEREIEELIALRDTLLPKLISGELRVKDMEKALEQHR